jgi:hypothetical protein
MTTTTIAFSTPVSLAPVIVRSGQRFILRSLDRWWGFGSASSVSYYQLQLTSACLYAVIWVLGMPANSTLQEAGWRTLVEIHSGLVLTLDTPGDVVRLTSVQDERSAFKVLPMSGGNFQLYSAVGSATAPMGVGRPVGSRLRPVPYGNFSMVNVALTESK